MTETDILGEKMDLHEPTHLIAPSSSTTLGGGSDTPPNYFDSPFIPPIANSDGSSQTPPPPSPGTITNSVGTSSTGSNHDSSSSVGNEVVVGVLSGMIVFLTLLFLMLVLPPCCRSISRRIPVSKKRIRRRYETIEGWLVSKRVKAHSATCDRLQKIYGASGNATSCSQVCSLSKELIASSLPFADQPNVEYAKPTTDLKIATSYDTAETTDSMVDDTCCSQFPGSVSKPPPVKNRPRRSILDDVDPVVPSQSPSLDEADENECPICMEPFVVDEIVSWSANVSCGHVFHHECIKEWLLRHDCCPCCRAVFLPIDAGTSQAPNKKSREEIVQLLDQHHERTLSSYYCIKDGLITLERPSVRPKVSKQESAYMKKCIYAIPKKTELAAKRGSRLQIRPVESVDVTEMSPSAPSLLETTLNSSNVNTTTASVIMALDSLSRLISSSRPTVDAESSDDVEENQSSSDDEDDATVDDEATPAEETSPSSVFRTQNESSDVMVDDLECGSGGTSLVVDEGVVGALLPRAENRAVDPPDG